MKVIQYSLIMLALVATVGCQQETNVVAPPTPAPVVVTEQPETPNKQTSNVANACVIDVRSQEEWESGHLSQAVHIPHTEIAQRIAEVTDNKSAKLVLY